MLDIRKTKAYRNHFFDLAGHRRAADLEIIVREWYPVTQAFCLSLPKFTALIAQEIFINSGARREQLEACMLTPVQIASEEFGVGRFGLDGIHYRMFARLGEPLGIGLRDLQQDPLGRSDATAKLVMEIRDAFSDLYSGAACLHVVEGTAYQIVLAMDHLFSDARDERGQKIFTAEQLEYISLHLEIELEHDQIASQFLVRLADSERAAERLESEAERFCGLFGDFWDGLALKAFEGQASTRPTLREENVVAL